MNDGHDALVVFAGDNHHPLRHWLHPQFRHCAVVVRTPDGWVIIDGAQGVPVVDVVVDDPDYDLLSFYRGQGLTVVPARRGTLPSSQWPLALRNCVGLVKVVLGLRAPWVWTPFQLYRRLLDDSRTA